MENTTKMLQRYRVPFVEKKVKIGGARKKKTHEEYVDELAIKNPNVEVIGQYINANTKIKHHCLIHDVIWEITPNNSLRGDGCKQCKYERISMKQSKTHDQYVEELKVKNPSVEVIGKYVNTKTKITHRCLIHNILWDTSPNSALKGGGCEICHVTKIRNSNTKTHEQYITEVKNVNPNITVIEKYYDSHRPILHDCKLHNIQWKASPASILQGCGCKICGIEKVAESLRKGHYQYVEEVNKINPYILVLGDYVGAFDKILHKCLIDDYEWHVTPNNILSGYGCPKCSGNIKKSHEQYVEQVSLINKNIEVIEKYINSITPILHTCLIDGYNWYASPDSILRGTGCPKCGGTLKKTHDEYVQELFKINPDIMVIGEYINGKTPILHKCKIDNFEWYGIPNNMRRRGGCQRCNESSGEREVRQYLERNNIKYIFQYPFNDCCDTNPLPFDFYLLDYNYCIEYQGKQHYEPIDFFGGQKNFEYIIKHDNIKNEYCKNNGIKLLRIPYYKNVEEELNNFLFI